MPEAFAHIQQCDMLIASCCHAATAMLLGLARHAGFRRAEATVLHLAADYAAALSQLLQLHDSSAAAFEYITSVLTNTSLDRNQMKAFQAAVKGSIAKLTQAGGFLEWRKHP